MHIAIIIMISVVSAGFSFGGDLGDTVIWVVNVRFSPFISISSLINAMVFSCVKCIWVMIGCSEVFVDWIVKGMLSITVFSWNTFNMVAFLQVMVMDAFPFPEI